jgi:hypothetical protein
MATPRHKSPPPSIPASGPARKSIDKKTSPRGKHTGGEVVYLGRVLIGEFNMHNQYAVVHADIVDKFLRTNGQSGGAEFYSARFCDSQEFVSQFTEDA